MHDLSADQQQRLERIKKKFLTLENNGLGRTHVEKLIPDAVPVKDRHYPMSPAVQEIVYKEVYEMLRLGVIEESESHNCPEAGKKNVCLDAQKLNTRTVKEAYALQNIDGILSRLDYTYFISTVDLKHAF